ncbi:MAG TPA: Uma2 family endonuclease [Dehalococcoidia bacterium]|nr:Uma2 family endonuclease [Dehalococcoidia bacterium]
MVTKQKLTLEEFLELPEDDVSLEYVDGEVVEKVSPQTQHAVLMAKLLSLLTGSAEAAGYKILPEIRFVFGEPRRAYVPDLGMARSDEIGVDPRGRWNNELRFPPTIAIEILSPGQSAGRLLEKLVFYMENGVRMAIVVDPDNDLTTVYEPGQEPRGVHVPDSIALETIIPGASIDLGDLFASLTP